MIRVGLFGCTTTTTTTSFGAMKDVDGPRILWMVTDTNENVCAMVNLQLHFFKRVRA